MSDVSLDVVTGIRSDLLVINKTDLAPLVGAYLEVMGRDSKRMRRRAVPVRAGDGWYRRIRDRHTSARQLASGDDMNMSDEGMRDYESRAFTIGVSGAPPTRAWSLLLALCRLLRTSYSLAVVTSEYPPSEDGGRAFLIRHKALASERIALVQIGGSLHAECGPLMETFRPDLLFVEGAGGVPGFCELADFTMHVVDANDGISPEESDYAAAADLLVINKTRPCPPLDASLNVVAQDAVRLRGDAPVVFAQIRYGLGVIEIARHVLVGWRQATAPATWLQSSQPGEGPSAE